MSLPLTSLSLALCSLVATSCAFVASAPVLRPTPNPQPDSLTPNLPSFRFLYPSPCIRMPLQAPHITTKLAYAVLCHIPWLSFGRRTEHSSFQYDCRVAIDVAENGALPLPSLL